MMSYQLDPGSITIRSARVLTLAGQGQRRGIGLQDLGIIQRADVHIRDGQVHSITSPGSGPNASLTIDAAGRVVMPGFVDAHTHLCWAGDRLDEWVLKRSAVPYLEILARGGGIMSTVRAVRSASELELSNELIQRLRQLQQEGTLAAEVKSGYGLTTSAEIKMLRAIKTAAKTASIEVRATACIGHAIDPSHPRMSFVQRTIYETLDAVHEFDENCVIDGYCELGAWNLDECILLFSRAIELGHCVRVHADQFNCLGITDWAIEHAVCTDNAPGVISVDHLEATPSSSLERIAQSPLSAVLLPCTGFHTDDRYADGRLLADAGAALVIASNCNPGSSPSSSMPMAIALAVRKCGLTPAEAIVASTANAAAMLGIHDRGTLEQGKRAELIMLRHTDENMLAYEFGGNPVELVVSGGRVLSDMTQQ